MQVTETLSQGLRREYNVVVPAGDLATQLDSQLANLKNKVRINGFRPGKVPVAHLKRVYGRSVMADVVQSSIDAANKQIVDANGLRLATQPKVELSTEQAEIEAALEARGDLAFKVALEVLPQFELGELHEIAIERLVADVEEQEVERSLERLADSRRTYVEREGEPAATGDKLTVDFVGKVDGETFDGGTGEAIEVTLGSRSFIPGFEEGLTGAVAGEQREVKATFPENYAARALAGKPVEFDVTIKRVAKPEPLAIDDDFAKSFGVETLDALKTALRDRIALDYATASRAKAKRKLLDALAARYAFDIPQGLVDQEFRQIWSQVEKEQQSTGKTFEQDGTTEEAARAEYLAIAQRRVRLGLVLAEIGKNADIKITDEELSRALMARARSFPGQEKEVWDFYRNNPNALAELRAPIFEDKAVDHLLSIVKVEERKVSPAELMTADDDEKVAA